VQNAKKNRSFAEGPGYQFDKKDRSTSNETFTGRGNGPLHVTVDDIEEAASEALNESSVHHASMLEKEDFRAEVQEENANK
jgi:hypothetical protein